MLVAMLAAGLSASVVVVDRIAIIVGNHAIKASDVERDVRLTDFMNRRPLDLSAAARKQAAERLIDQQILRTEIATGGYARANDAEAEGFQREIERERFSGSSAQMRAELARYGLTEDELREYLLWQLTVLKFIEQKFRPGVSVSDQDVRSYYDQHVSELNREHPKNSSFEPLQAEIRSTLEGEAVNREFENRIGEARKRTRIEYRQGVAP
jgi:parvulin-like peptidyl-prolyl isomerase